MILLAGQDNSDISNLNFFIKELGFTLPSLIWAYCFSIIVDFFVTLYQKLLEKNMHIFSQLYFVVFGIVCFVYGLMTIQALMKKQYADFIHSSRILMAILYLITAVGLIYFGLNLIYEVFFLPFVLYFLDFFNRFTRTVKGRTKRSL